MAPLTNGVVVLGIVSCTTGGLSSTNRELATVVGTPAPLVSLTLKA